MRRFVSAEELKNNLNTQGWVVADCRADLSDHKFGRRSYKEGHIPGSVFIDAERDLTGVISEHGGRHPLPDMERFKEFLESQGISSSSTVVAHGMFAARFIFMLQLIGVDGGMLLDGGIDRWKNLFYPLESEEVQPQSGNITSSPAEGLIVHMPRIRDHRDSMLLIDCRSPERYRGENEPVDPIAGHIPGAVNRFWMDNFSDDGILLPIEDLKLIYRVIAQTEKEVVLQCGSGVTACWNWAVLEELGLKSKIYMGSWSDWISYPENVQ